jgi:hypothetical protein
MVGPQVQYGLVHKVRFFPGFDPWTLQPVVDLLVGFLVLVSFEIDNISIR